MARDHGKAEGLPDRLEDFANRLQYDKSLQWGGLGIYDDLRAAVAVLRGKPVPPLRDDPKSEMEFDL